MRADAVMKRCSGAIVMAKRRCEGLREATGADLRSWAALPQSRRSGYTRRKRCAHVSPRRMGGARMGAVRSRISMTIISAPQCRQTKAGRAATTASCGGMLNSGKRRKPNTDRPTVMYRVRRGETRTPIRGIHLRETTSRRSSSARVRSSSSAINFSSGSTV